MNFKDEELAAMGIVKDRRRRYIYVIKDTQSGYQLTEGSLKIVNMYQTRFLLISVVFVLMYSFLKIQPIILISAFLVVGLLITLVFKKWYLPRYNIVKVRDEDFAKLNTPDVYKTIQHNYLMDLVIGFALLYILYSPLLDPGAYGAISTLDTYVIYASMAGAGAYIVYCLLNYFKYRSKSKAAKKGL